MADILKFPSRDNKSVIRLKLFSEEEISVALLAINTYCAEDYKFTDQNIEFLDPEIAINCLQEALKSIYFSDEFKILVRYILSNVERQ